MKRLLGLGALVVAIAVVAPASARLAHYPVNVTVTGSGTVSGQDPDGNKINCPPKCSATMKQNTNMGRADSAVEGAESREACFAEVLRARGRRGRQPQHGKLRQAQDQLSSA